MAPSDPLGVTDRLVVGPESYTIYCPDRIPGVDQEKLATRPGTIRIILENLLRNFPRGLVSVDTIRAVAEGQPIPGDGELPFFPYRVLLQDFTGVPVLVDLTTLRSAGQAGSLPPERINPSVPVDLVVDHSVQVDSFGTPDSLRINLDREYARNSERYGLLRWARTAFDRLRVIPPGNGIVHQVNLEYLASVVAVAGTEGERAAFPDTLIGTDSHTPMINGLGVLGWGVGGIEAEAVMLGEPYFMGVPEVVGVRLFGGLPEGSTATDLVLTVTRRLRERGVVDRFVEFYGPGVRHLSVPDRATIANMCPEYGATAALFPIDEATITYLKATGRPPAEVTRVEAYARTVGLWAREEDRKILFDDHLDIDLGSIVPTISGPRNPEETVALDRGPEAFARALAADRKDKTPGASAPAGAISDGSIVIAAITSCTNTSNPSVMIGAGLIAERARALGLKVPAYVKTSLAPGSKVVTAYLARAGLLRPLEELGFSVVGYGCTTCIGNSGPLIPEVARAVTAQNAFVAAVLSGNRNFEARIHNQVRANYLMSPMLVVAHALAGRMDVNLARDPIGRAADGHAVYLRDLWPTAEEIRSRVEANLDPSMFREKYREITVGDAHWEALAVPEGRIYPWDPESTYLREAPYLDSALPPLPMAGEILVGARALLALGDRVSTDHISPAGEITAASPAGEYLTAHGVPVAEFNTYGSRRGNHEVMVRGTFANVRLKNRLAAPRVGGFTAHLPDGEIMSVFDAAEKYRTASVPLIILAGANYGQGSSRDWAAKGPLLLGVRAVLAESFERIHRSNLVDMGILPLAYMPGEGAAPLGLTGRERFTLATADGGALRPRGRLLIRAESEEGAPILFSAEARIYSTIEVEYLRAGGILPFVYGKMQRGG
ncbi:MAG: aconitate hydratase AcnA [Thermoplasmata archaeon]